MSADDRSRHRGPSSSNGAAPPPTHGWVGTGSVLLGWLTRVVGLAILIVETLGGHDPLTIFIAGAMVGVGEFAVEAWRDSKPPSPP